MEIDILRENIEQYRKKCGIKSRTLLGELAGLGPATMPRIFDKEDTTYYPSSKTIGKIAQVLSCSPYDLVYPSQQESGDNQKKDTFLPINTEMLIDVVDQVDSLLAIYNIYITDNRDRAKLYGSWYNMRMIELDIPDDIRRHQLLSLLDVHGIVPTP